MWAILGWIPSILNALKAMLPAVLRIGSLFPFLTKLLGLAGRFFLSPVGWIVTAVTASIFPQVLGVVMQMIGIGALKMAFIMYNIMNNMISGTSINTDYTSVTELMEEAVNQLPDTFIAVGSYFHFISILGLILSTITICAIVNTIASLVRRH